MIGTGRGIVFLFFFSFVSIVFSAEPPGNVETLLQANQAYTHADYPKAIEQYEQLLKQGYVSGEIHFNLGNAYFRNNQLGKAIFHFRKGQRLAPRDSDIQYNLAFAREKVTDKIEPVSSLWAHVASLLDFVTEKERYLFVLVWGGLSLILGLVCLMLKNNKMRWAKNTSFAILIVSLLLLFGREKTMEEFGVVSAPEISVYSGFEQDSAVLFKIHEGVELIRTDSAGETWAQISLADGKKGWVRTEGILFDAG